MTIGAIMFPFASIICFFIWRRSDDWQAQAQSKVLKDIR